VALRQSQFAAKKEKRVNKKIFHDFCLIFVMKALHRKYNNNFEEFRMRNRCKKVHTKAVVKLRLTEECVLFDKCVHIFNHSAIKSVREFGDIFGWCALRCDGDALDCLKTYENACALAYDTGQGFECWSRINKYLVFGLHRQTYQVLSSSNIIDHIGTLKFDHDGSKKDLYVLDQAKSETVGFYLRMKAQTQRPAAAGGVGSCR
jgi:hypothetical protein